MLDTVILADNARCTDAPELCSNAISANPGPTREPIPSSEALA